MLVAIPPHMSVSQYMGYLKSKSSLMIFDRYTNLKSKYGNRHFWCRGVNLVQSFEKLTRVSGIRCAIDVFPDIVDLHVRKGHIHLGYVGHV